MSMGPSPQKLTKPTVMLFFQLSFNSLIGSGVSIKYWLCNLTDCLGFVHVREHITVSPQTNYLFPESLCGAKLN